MGGVAAAAAAFSGVSEEDRTQLLEDNADSLLIEQWMYDIAESLSARYGRPFSEREARAWSQRFPEQALALARRYQTFADDLQEGVDGDTGSGGPDPTTEAEWRAHLLSYITNQLGEDFTRGVETINEDGSINIAGLSEKSQVFGLIDELAPQLFSEKISWAEAQNVVTARARTQGGSVASQSEHEPVQDRANIAGRLEGLYDQWGVPFTDDDVQRYSRQIWENRLSEDDFVDNILKPASADLWQNKPENVSWAAWSSPYAAEFASLLEVDAPTVKSEEFTRLLQGETLNLTEFRKQVRRDPRWLATDNARQQADSTIHFLKSQMGF